ncbi:MAG: sigma-70 family RNA polymerase sigma factor, partial [Planctomycetota bacterium]
MNPLGLELLTRHQRSLSALAAHLLQDHHGGEDAFQDAAAQVLDAGRMGVPAHLQGAQLGSWLRTGVRRTAAKARGRRRGRARRERAAAREEALPSTEELAVRSESARRLHEAVESLDPPLAAIIRDVYFGELTIREVAERDGTPGDTLRSRLKKARRILRQRLEEHDAERSAAAARSESRNDWAAALVPLAVLHDGQAGA